MVLQPIACNNCGAPLQVPETARFVVCTACGSQLAVKSNESARFTEELKAVSATTKTLAADVQALKLQSEMAEIDRLLEAARDQLPRRRDGQPVSSAPHATAGIVAGTVAGCVLLAFAAVCSAVVGKGAGIAIPLFLLMIVLLILSASASVNRIAEVREVESLLTERRQIIQEELSAALGRLDFHE